MADDVDALFALPLEEFTTARNELAKRLGDPSIRELKKPSVAAWTVNQLARRRALDLRRLVRAGEQLEEAQNAAVRGGDQRAFERARRDEREAVRRLRVAAAELLEESGRPAPGATLDRVARTLHAAAATEPGRARLREGRLTEELEPQGFDALAALAGSGPAPGRRRRTAARTPSAAAVKRVRKARADADEARRTAETEAARVAEAESRLRLAERDLVASRAAAERARVEADRLERRARELEATV